MSPTNLQQPLFVGTNDSRYTTAGSTQNNLSPQATAYQAQNQAAMSTPEYKTKVQNAMDYTIGQTGDVPRLSTAKGALQALYDTAQQYTRHVNLSDLKITPEVIQALQDVKAGKTSRSNLPLLVQKNADGQFEVLDGKHRLVQAFNQGLQSYPAITNEPLYRQLSATENGLNSVNVASHARNGNVIAQHSRSLPNSAISWSTLNLSNK